MSADAISETSAAIGHASHTKAERSFCRRQRCHLLWPPFNPAHISAHFGQLIGLIVVGIFVAIVLAFVFLYINSVFRFILFDSVLRRQCSIGDGWRKWYRAGGRFFLWQIVFQIAAWLFLLALVGLPLALALAAGWTTDLRATRRAVDCRSDSVCGPVPECSC